MPTLSKRFSFKSLKRRFTSDSIDVSERSEKTPSPSRLGRSGTLPPDVGKGDHVIGGSSESTPESSSGSGFNPPSSGTGNRSRPLVLSKELLPPLPTPPATIGMPSPQLFASPETSPIPFDPIQNLAVTGVMHKVNAGPQSSKTEKVLNKIGKSRRV